MSQDMNQATFITVTTIWQTGAKCMPAVCFCPSIPKRKTMISTHRGTRGLRRPITSKWADNLQCLVSGDMLFIEFWSWNTTMNMTFSIPAFSIFVRGIWFDTMGMHRTSSCVYPSLSWSTLPSWFLLLKIIPELERFAFEWNHSCLNFGSVFHWEDPI